MKKLFLLSLLFFSIISLAQAQVPTYVPTNGLVGWWPFNGNANDESGNGNNGVVNGATLTSDRLGTINTAYYFDGAVNTNILVTLSNNIHGNKTFALWVKYPLSFINEYSQPITCANTPNDYLSVCGNSQIYITNGTVGNFYDGKSGLFSTQKLNDSIWHHVVLIMDYGNSKSTLYIDGVLNGSMTSSRYSVDPNISQFIFGSGSNNSIVQNATMFGDIDDIGIWNRVLDSVEIASLYNTNATGYEKLTSETLELYPNPASTILTVNNNTVIKEANILSIDGRFIQKTILTAGKNSIDITAIETGIYILKVGDKVSKFSVVH
jgi:hypothetical protein